MADSINNRFTYKFQCICRVVGWAVTWLRFFRLVRLRTGDSFLSCPTEHTTVPLWYGNNCTCAVSLWRINSTLHTRSCRKTLHCMTPSLTQTIASNDLMIVHDELERMWKEAVAAYFKASSADFIGRPRKNNEKISIWTVGASAATRTGYLSCKSRKRDWDDSRSTHIYILSRVWVWLITGFGLVIGIIPHLYKPLLHKSIPHGIVFSVSFSLHYPLLSSGFQCRTFPFLRVPELSSASATSFSQQQLTMTNSPVTVRVTYRLEVYRQSAHLGTKLPATEPLRS
jgi:hypothetical protein